MWRSCKRVLSPIYLAEDVVHLIYDVRGPPTVMTARLTIAALVTVGLAGMPFAAEGKRHIRHHILKTQPASYSTSGESTAQSGTFGTSGNPVGTVTAPSVGSYSWPSVGVTNAVPTWSNTSPPVRK